MRSVEFVSRSLRVKESQDWQGNRGILQAETTDHTLEEAEQYVKTNYPVFKKYRVRRAEPGFRANVDSSQFARSHAHVHDVDSAMDYLQLQENPVMSGSWQHSHSIGYSWHTNENRSSGIAVLYYEDRGMGSDEIIVAAKDRQNLAAAVGVFRDAGVVPQLKKKGVTEATGDNKFDAMMGTMQGNAELLKSVMSEFLTIYYGALDEEDMTDHIAYNLGDFFNGVKRSRDPVLQKSYAYVRDLAEEDVDVQANGTLRAIQMMLGDPAYTPPPKPPMSAADRAWVDRLVNAMTAALASHGIMAHPNWNKGNNPGMAESLSLDQQFDTIEEMVESLAQEHGVDADVIWEDFESVDDHELLETAAWRRKEGKSKKGGLNAKGVASYRRENPGSKLQTAVTTKPSKLKPGSKAAKRRKSFCARMGGVKGPMKKPNGKPTRKALALRKWNC